jgi:YaiO family outer membrane protein
VGYVRYYCAGSLVLLALAAPVGGQDLSQVPSQNQELPDGLVQVPSPPVATPSALAPSLTPPRGEISAIGSYQALSEPLRSWTFVQFRGLLHVGQSDVWSGEMVDQSEYGDTGIFLGLANTHAFNQDWFAFTSAGTSVGGFFLPRFRANETLSRKWLGARQLITTMGGGYYEAKDAHRDYSVAAGAIYYLPPPVIIEGGVTWTDSTPGGVVSRYQFLAVTQGRERKRYIIVRIAGGHEAYQLIAPTSPIADFASRSASLTVRQWVNSGWGVSLGAEIYSNSSYSRRAVTFGAFRQF